MTETPLDIAHAAMEAAPDDDTRRLRFYERLADSELFLLLEGEPSQDRISPHLFDTADGRFALAFDREHRLTAFTGKAAPYAALSGRAIAKMLADQGIGIALNPDVASSSILIPAEAIEWLREALSKGTEESQAQAAEFRPPHDLPESLIQSLDTKLATAEGLAECAYLAGVTYSDRTQTHLLAFIDPKPGAEEPLAKAASETLVFSGLEQGTFDVGFFKSTDAAVKKLTRVGLRFDLPKPAEAISSPQNPNTPPRLR